LDTYHPVTP